MIHLYLIQVSGQWYYYENLISNQVEGYFMKAGDMFKSVFSESCSECLARFYLNKCQIHTIGKLEGMLLPKLMSGAVEDELVALT